MYDANRPAGENPVNEQNFAACSVLHFEPEAHSRHRVLAALQQLRFGRIEYAGDFKSLCHGVHDGGFDLIVSELGPARVNVCELFKRVRHSTFGRDPFPGIIMTSAQPTQALVQRAIDAGPDHLIKWPFSNNQISVRIAAIVNLRRPFVVTFDYIGPDRRNDPTRQDGAELIEVPNALRAKARKDVTASATPAAVTAAKTTINMQRIECCYPAIAFAIEQLYEGFHGSLDHFSREQSLATLLATTADLKRRVAGTDYADTAKLCAALASITSKIHAAGPGATEADYELLRHTGMALQRSFEPPDDGRADDVSSTAALITGNLPG
jgi:DNA-binding response OmpR family regulator